MHLLKKIVFKKNYLLMVALAFQVGCANLQDPKRNYPDAPMATNFAKSSQQHVQASNHWALIADDLASQVKANMNEKKLVNRPVFVNLNSESTDFTRAFHDFLITSLVKKGVAVSKVSAGNTVYNYKIQTISYDSTRSTQLPSQYKWSALAAGLVVIRAIDHLLDQNNSTILAGGVLADIWTSDIAPNLEIIITTSILSSNVYVSRTSDIYYANQSDAYLYQTNQSMKKINVFDEPFYQQY